jgi:D-alanyl-D-alanine carboxypeptidase
MKRTYIFIFLLIFLTNAACWKSDDGDTRATPRKSPGANSGSPSGSATNSPSPNNSINTMNSGNGEIKSGGFTANLPQGFEQPTEDVGRRLLKEYGSVFVARGGTTPPKTVIFKNEQEVAAFQSSLQKSSEQIGSYNLELQTAAMNALKEAINEAKQNNLNITPRGADSARRSYNETVELWASRVNPGLVHWVSKGKLQQTEADRIKSLSPFEQVPEIFKLEAQGIFFAKDLSKSIIYSVAPPGTSQHLSMLALDVSENDNEKVREILARHGWHQTVQSDLPHFTFLGAKESDLEKLGLKKVSDGGRTFWLPNI